MITSSFDFHLKNERIRAKRWQVDAGSGQLQPKDCVTHKKFKQNRCTYASTRGARKSLTVVREDGDVKICEFVRALH